MESNAEIAESMKTPSRSRRCSTKDADVTQTPRRSVRKSIKPVQEYENIIAQKGVNAKRFIFPLVEEFKDELSAESKWEPAVIGRASTKRGKKAKRAQRKKLQRQKQILEANIVEGINEANVDDITKIVHENVKPAVNVINDTGNEGKEPCVDKHKLNDNAEANELQPEKQTEQFHQIFHKMEKVDELSDTFVQEGEEEGDTEMATMPITADDDSMENIDNPLSIPPPVGLPKVQLSAERSTKADDSDCIMISFSESSTTEQSCEQVDDDTQKSVVVEISSESPECIMSPLLVCSDDDEEVDVVDDVFDAVKSPALKEKVDFQNEVLTAPLDRTFDANATPFKNTKEVLAQTPITRTSMNRVPTPFKSNKPIPCDIITEPQEEEDKEGTPRVLMEPREIKLNGCRKRSFSFSVDRPKKYVTFYSPANTTVSIYDGDLMKSVIKEDVDNNITERRKRSMSVTETERDVIAYFKERKPTVDTPNKQSKLQQPVSKSKMPNFAALHEKHFHKMESIIDNVARKFERANYLSNSKVRPESVQKGPRAKNSVLRDFNTTSTGINKAIPKARQRIELSGIEHSLKVDTNAPLHALMRVRSNSKPDLSVLHNFSISSKLPTKMCSSTNVLSSNTKPKLPNPRLDVTLNALKTDLRSVASTKVISKANAIAKTASTTVSHHFQPSLPDSRPRFNTSTAIERPTKVADKLDDRRKRHLDMYKSRTTSRTDEKKGEILKGVRTNRRFELQMMCRNRLN